MNENIRSDEVSLSDLFKVLSGYKKLIVGLPIFGAISAAIFASIILQPTWEASAVLEIGQVGQAGQMLVEPAESVVTRMMLPSFANGAINSLDTKSGELFELKEFYKTLKVRQIKEGNLIEVKLRGPSAEKANDLIQSVVGNLQSIHAKMMAVTIERNKQQLQMLLDDIKKVSSETDLLKNKLFATHNWNAFDATLSATVLKDKSAELRDLIQRKIILEEQLAPSRTYTTRVMDEVYISDAPVSPNKRLIISMAVFLGLFGAIVLAFAHNAIASKTSN